MKTKFKTKKLLALVLSLAMLVGMVPMASLTAYAEYQCPIGHTVRFDGDLDEWYCDECGSIYKDQDLTEVIGVTVVSLDKTTTQTIDVGGSVTFTATVEPSGATDKTVKWSVGGTNASAVKLYSDQNCTTEVGTDATSTLTVYAKGISAGDATVTVTSNADSTKSASCNVTVNEATVTEWEIGDSISLAGKWFYNDDQGTSIYCGAEESETVPNPSYLSNPKQWSFSGCIVVTVENNNYFRSVYLTAPAGKSESDVPTGFKIKSGDGSQSSPYTFELVYAADPTLDPVAYKAATVNETTHEVTFADASCTNYTAVTADATTWGRGGYRNLVRGEQRCDRFQPHQRQRHGEPDPLRRRGADRRRGHRGNIRQNPEHLRPERRHGHADGHRHQQRRGHRRQPLQRGRLGHYPRRQCDRCGRSYVSHLPK